MPHVATRASGTVLVGWTPSSPSSGSSASAVFAGSLADPRSRVAGYGSVPVDERDRLEVDEARMATVGPVDRRRHQLTEQRVRTVGAAQELGMGLGADPIGMGRQLDELDQPVVGR